MWRAILLVLGACDSGTPSHVETAPPPLPPKPDATVVAPTPPMPRMTIATWKTGTPTNRVAQASCIKAADRSVWYANWVARPAGPAGAAAPNGDAGLIDGVVRFCIYYHWDQPPAEVGCWAVDPDKGTYTANVGMPTVTRIPEADDDGGSSIDLGLGGGKLSLKGHDLRWAGKSKLKIPGTDGVLFGDEKRAFVLDRDGVVYEVTPSESPTLVRTLHPPKC